MALGRTVDQPGQRRADPDVRRRLRADGVRHRRDHGRAGARPARLRLRRERSACRSARWSQPADGEVPRTRRSCRTPTTSRWSTRASFDGMPATARRSARSSAGSRRRAAASAPSTTACATGCSRASATGAARSRSSTAPDCGMVPVPGRPAPGRAARRRGLRAEGQVAARRGGGLGQHDLPEVRRARAARDRHDGHVRRLVLVLPALLRRAQRRGAVGPRGRRQVDAGRPVHRRRRARDPAPDVRALLHEGARGHGPGRRAGAVRAPVHAGDGHPRRREDVQVQGQHRQPARDRRALRRGHARAATSSSSATRPRAATGPTTASRGCTGSSRGCGGCGRAGAQRVDRRRDARWASRPTSCARRTGRSRRSRTTSASRFATHTAIAAVIELVNEIYRARTSCWRRPRARRSCASRSTTAASLMFPFAPHLRRRGLRAADRPARMGGAWPEADPALRRAPTTLSS